MQAALQPFHDAHASGLAWRVADTLSPIPPHDDPGRLYEFYRASNAHKVESDIRYSLKYSQTSKLPLKESSAWTDIFVSFWKAVGEILRAEEASNQGRLKDGQWVVVYDAWKEVANTIVKHTTSGVLPPWTVMCMYSVGNHLRLFALKADSQLAKAEPKVTFSTGLQEDVSVGIAKNNKLEEAARVFSKMFSLCLGDRDSDINESRKWGVYFVANLLFKVYFKIKAISLSNNVVKSIEAQRELPMFDLYPKSHTVTYKYYVGILAFLQEDYQKAELHLTKAWDHCFSKSTKNQELILTYLIPCRLITKHNIPSAALLSAFPHLQNIFGPLVACIKSGDLSGFDSALLASEPEFVKRRIYLTLERGRDIALRNLLRKVFLAAGYDDLKEGQTEKDRMRKSRIHIAHFAAALRMGTRGEGSGQFLDDDEVECLLANMIYKGLIKGYIARDHGIVVLNKKGAFPGTGV